MKLNALSIVFVVTVFGAMRDANAQVCSNHQIGGWIDVGSLENLDYLSSNNYSMAVAGTSSSPYSSGVAGMLHSSGSCAPLAIQPAGVSGASDGYYGVWGGSTGVAIEGDSTGSGGTGVAGYGLGYGVYGYSSSGYGLYGIATGTGGNTGIYGTSASGRGVVGVSTTTGDGVAGTSNANGYSGVSGWNYSSGNGMWAGSSSGNGLVAQGGNYAYGVYATSGSSGTGVYGASGAFGVYGYGNANYSTGVEGYAYGSYTYGLFGTCGGSNCAAIHANGNIEYTGTLTHMSDERLKRDIQPLNGSIDKLLQLRGVSFYWREPDKHGNVTTLQRGFVAQEYEKVFPEWVTTDKDGYKMISTTGLDSLEVESIRVLKAENDDLKKRIEALEAGRRPLVSSSAAWGWMTGLALAAAVALGSRRKSKKDE